MMDSDHQVNLTLSNGLREIQNFSSKFLTLTAQHFLPIMPPYFFFFFDIFSDTCTKIRPSAAETLYLLFVLAYCKMSYSSRAKFLRTSLISLDNNSYENMPLLKDFGRKIFHETCDYKVVNLMPHLKVGLFVCCHVQIMKSSTATVLH